MRYSRRDILKLTGGLLAAGPLTSGRAFAESQDATSGGLMSGPPRGVQVGMQILRDGGNAIDAAVAGALTVGVTAPNFAGIGGYGGHLVIALKDRRLVTAIDFNSAAPRTARPDMFQRAATGEVRGYVNERGWLAAGVPGILAGLQLALDRYGTRSFRDVVRPAIQIAREGIPVPEPLNRAITTVSPWMRQDAASLQLYFRDGEPLPVGAVYRNPDLAALLETLAADNTVESFYRGEIGRRIAAAFQKHGGLVTVEDMAAYRAREIAPLVFDWRGCTIHTAPLAAGGLTVLQALGILKALRWESLPAAAKTQAFVEALRVAWADRLRLLGDSEKATVPAGRLLSEDYARELAQKVSGAISARKPLAIQTSARLQTGTVHMNSVDRHGNMVALTMTQGGPFGAGVTVEGLGLTLGHGMARFDVEPGHPNAPGPGKRPLTNMCPTVVLRNGTPVLSLGAAGTRTIPNAVSHVLLQFVGADAALDTAVASQRIHTEGNLDVTIDGGTPAADVTTLKAIGYRVAQGFVGTLNAIAVDPQTGTARAAAR